MSQLQGTTDQGTGQIDLARYTDKMVNLIAWTDEEDLASKGRVVDTKGDMRLVELSGRITVVNPDGSVFLFKPRSQRTTSMLERDNVTKIELAGSATLRPVGQKALRPVTVQTARRHLADFHAYPLTKLNTMSDDLALKLHDELDHSDLGHNHTLADTGSNSSASAATTETRADVLARIDAA